MRLCRACYEATTVEATHFSQAFFAHKTLTEATEAQWQSRPSFLVPDTLSVVPVLGSRDLRLMSQESSVDS